MPGALEREIVARDREIDNPYTKDAQITAIRGARNYLGDKLIRVATPHRLLDPKAGPLIAVRLWVLTRKTLGGLQTDLSARVLQGRWRSRWATSTRQARSPASAAAACTATARWKARSWAAACSRAAWRDGLRQARWDDEFSRMERSNERRRQERNAAGV